MADFPCGTHAPPPLTSMQHQLSKGENPTLQRRTHGPLLSDPLSGKSPERHTLDPQASTHTPQRLPWPRPLPVATRLPHGGEMPVLGGQPPCPHDHLPFRATPTVSRAVPCLRPGPVGSELRTHSPLGQPSGASACRANPRPSACQKEGGPAPEGAQSSAGLGLVRRENRVSRGWVSRSGHSTSRQGHLSRHTREALGEKGERTRAR